MIGCSACISYLCKALSRFFAVLLAVENYPPVSPLCPVRFILLPCAGEDVSKFKNLHFHEGGRPLLFKLLTIPFQQFSILLMLKYQFDISLPNRSF
jgi:hypothetical protein